VTDDGKVTEMRALPTDPRASSGGHRSRRHAGAWIALASCVVLPIYWGCSSGSTAEVTYNVDQKAAFRSSLSVVGDLSWEVRVARNEEGLIQAKTPISLRTFGDLVTIEVRGLGPAATQVRVSSTSRQLLDWGQSTRNAKAFFDRLDARIGAHR
jgi:hypothetical protein